MTPRAIIRQKRRRERRGKVRDSSQFQKTEKLWFYCKKAKSAESNHFLVDNHEQLGCGWIFLSQKRVLSTPYSFAAHSVLTFYRHIKNKGGGLVVPEPSKPFLLLYIENSQVPTRFQKKVRWRTMSSLSKQGPADLSKAYQETRLSRMRQECIRNDSK